MASHAAELDAMVARWRAHDAHMAVQSSEKLVALHRHHGELVDLIAAAEADCTETQQLFAQLPSVTSAAERRVADANAVAERYIEMIQMLFLILLVSKNG